MNHAFFSLFIRIKTLKSLTSTLNVQLRVSALDISVL